jgi:hypothetical protein
MAKNTRRAQPVNIGYGSARDYWHSHACPAHSRFRETSTRENAIECAKAIEDVRGWYWSDKYPGIDPRDAKQEYDAFNRQLFADCPELATIKDIAETAKHGGQLGRGGVQVKEIQGAGVGGIVQEFGPFGMHEHKPVCTLRAVLEDGSEKPLPELLTRAMQYWRDKLL